MTWTPIIVAANRREAEQKVQGAMPEDVHVLAVECLHPSSVHRGEAYAAGQVNGPERTAAEIAAARAS